MAMIRSVFSGFGLRHAAFAGTLVFAISCRVIAATAADSVQIQLLVDNGTSTSTTTSDTATSSSSSANSFFANGAPNGPLSPAANQNESPPLLGGSVLVVAGQDSGGQGATTQTRFQWKTSVPTSAIFEWGETAFYEMGRTHLPLNTAQNKDTFGYLYQEAVPGLVPGKTYAYRLTVRDENGRVSGYQGTHAVPVVTERLLPENVSAVSLRPTVTPTEKQLIIEWENPDTKDFSEVRVVRSPFGFPKDPLDGRVVYEGGAENVTDVFIGGDVNEYFYTIFAKRKDGTYSSGAVATTQGLFGGVSVKDSPSRSVQSTAELATLAAADFSVILYDANGGERVHALSETRLAVKAGERVTISVPYEKFPEVLKTILVHITPSRSAPEVIQNAAGPANNTMSFLLSVNAASTLYEATFLAPSDGGLHDVEVKILDYHTDILRNITVQNAFDVKKTEMNFQNVLKNVKSQFKSIEKPLVLAIFIILILLTLALRKIVRFF